VPAKLVEPRARFLVAEALRPREDDKRSPGGNDLLQGDFMTLPSTWFRIVGPCGLLLVVGAFVPGRAADEDPDPEPNQKVQSTVVSGLRVGDSPLPFNPLHCNGKQAGKKSCLV